MSWLELYFLTTFICEVITIFDVSYVEEKSNMTRGEGLLIVIIMLLPLVNIYCLFNFMREGGFSDVYNTALGYYRQMGDKNDD